MNPPCKNHSKRTLKDAVYKLFSHGKTHLFFELKNPGSDYRYLDTRPPPPCKRLASGVQCSPVLPDPTSLIQRTLKSFNISDVLQWGDFEGASLAVRGEEGGQFLKYFSETGGWCNRERQSGTAGLQREPFFFSLSLRGKEEVEVQEGKTDEGKKKEGIVLPEFIVAGCGRTLQGRFTEKERETLTRRGGGRKASSNLIRDSFCLSSSTLQKFFFVFLQMRGLRTSWVPRRTLASGPRPSQTWENPLRCSCQGPGTNRYNIQHEVHPSLTHLHLLFSTDSPSLSRAGWPRFPPSIGSCNQAAGGGRSQMKTTWRPSWRCSK